MIPRFGEPIKHGQNYTRRAGAYAILPREGALLLTAQVTDIVDIQLPGGGIDKGEAPLAALHREVREETGWSIAAPRALGTFRRFVFMPDYDLWAEKVCHIFIARPVMQKGAPTEPDHTALWASPTDALGLLGNAGDQHFLRRFIDTQMR